MLTFCARCPALVERLLASGSARLDHLPGALLWLQEGPRLRPLLDGPGWSRTTARRFEGRRVERSGETACNDLHSTPQQDAPNCRNRRRACTRSRTRTSTSGG